MREYPYRVQGECVWGDWAHLQPYVMELTVDFHSTRPDRQLTAAGLVGSRNRPL